MSTHNKKSVDHCHLEKRKATKTLMLVNFAVVNCCFASVLGTLKYIKLLWGIVGLSFNCWYVEWFLLKYLVPFDIRMWLCWIVHGYHGPILTCWFDMQVFMWLFCGKGVLLEREGYFELPSGKLTVRPWKSPSFLVNTIKVVDFPWLC